MNMKKLVALLLALVMVFALCACGSKDNQDTGKKDDGKKTAMKADDIPDEMTSSDGKYQVAFVTDVGDLKDKSFNQGTYDGVKLYANANSKSYKYYKPANGDKATDDDRYDAMKAAVDNGAEVVVAAGFLQGTALAKAAEEFTDTKFVFIDGWAFDKLTNLAAINFREEQCGYLAGYAAVMEGYTKLGFTGGGGHIFTDVGHIFGHHCQLFLCQHGSHLLVNGAAAADVFGAGAGADDGCSADLLDGQAHRHGHAL